MPSSVTSISPTRPLTRALALIGIALAVILERLPTIGFAYLNVDESAYLLIGAAMRHGAIPYIDIIDRKPVGLYLIYAFADAVFPEGIWGARVLGIICTIISAWLVAYIARRYLRVSWPTTVLAALFFNGFVMAFGGDAAQYNVFVMPFVAGAAVLVLRTLSAIKAGQTPSAMELGLAGLLFGLAMQIKYTPAFEAIGFGILLIMVAWQHRDSLGPVGRRNMVIGLIAMVVGGLLPTVLAAVAYWRIGYLDEFIFYNFTVNAVRTATDYPPKLLAFRLVEIIFFAHPLVIFSVLYLRRRGAAATADIDRPGPWVEPVLTIWLGAALFGAVVQRQPYLHYFYAVVPPLALFAAAGLQVAGRFTARAKIAAGVYLFLTVIGYFIGWRYEIADHGSAYLPRVIAKTLKAENVRSLYVFNYFGILYYLTGLDSPTRYTLPTHLLRDLEAASFRFDALGEVKRILDQKPDVVVVTRPFAGNIAENRIHILDAALQEGYCTWRTYAAGRDTVYLYRFVGGAGDPSRACGEPAGDHADQR